MRAHPRDSSTIRLVEFEAPLLHRVIVAPAKEAVIQLAFIAPSLQITPSRRRPGPIVQPAWSCPMGYGRRSDQTQVLVEAWVPACAGMARKGNSRTIEAFQVLLAEERVHLGSAKR